LRNLLCLCRGCHFWWHNSADTFDTENLRREVLSEADNEYLFRERKSTVKFSISDLEEIKHKILTLEK
jgi:hypothetical protein